MRLLDHAQAEASHTYLSDGSIVQNLIVDMLQRNDLTNVSLLEEISCADDLVVQGQVVYLQEGRLDTHFWLTMLLDKKTNFLDLFFRFCDKVDFLKLLSSSFAAFSFHSLSDFLINGIIFIVQVSQLNERDSGLEYIQVKLTEQFHCLVN